MRRLGRPLSRSKLPGEHHVFRRHRLAVGEARQRIEIEGDVGTFVVGLDRLGDQTIERERLVIAARHQSLDHMAADRGQRQAAHDQRVQAVEGAEHTLNQPAALGRIGIHIGHGGKGRRHRRLAVHGDGMARLGGSGAQAGRRTSQAPANAARTGDRRTVCALKPCPESGDVRHGHVGKGSNSLNCATHIVMFPGAAPVPTGLREFWSG